MANEITGSISLSATNGNLKITIPSESLTWDMSHQAVASGVQIVGTSAETVALGDLTSAALAYFKNLDATNFIEWGIDSSGFVKIGILPAGKSMLLYLAGSIVYQLKADTANCKVQYCIFD